MPLIVPVLRLAYVFLNIFDTFKTLRPPPPSTKNDGQPSVRAISQRKRAMKGIMAVWIVWGSFAMYERTLDSVVRLFVPFYDEFKSLVILFFVFTRARGAEPIFLHAIRPFIKPYAATLDSSLELVATTGDFMLLLALIPVQFVLSYYRRWISRGDPRPETMDSQSVPEQVRRESEKVVADSDQSSKGVNPAPRGRGSVISGNTLTRGTGRPTTHAKSSFQRQKSSGAHNPAPRATRSTVRRSSQSSQGAPPPYEIWYPPLSAHDNAPTNPLTGLPTPPEDDPPAFDTSLEIKGDDWRQYPAFPSAYPSTPLTAQPKLHVANDTRASSSSSLSEELRRPPPGLATVPLGATAGRVPGSPRGSPISDSAREWSDNQGSDEEAQDQDHIMDVEEDTLDDSEVDSEEDDFDVTLRTPSRKNRFQAPVKEKASLTSASTDSLVSRSTHLSTTDNGSSLRTRTNSIASTTLTTSDAASIVGIKRRLPRGEKAEERFRIKPSSKMVAASTRSAGVQLHTRMRAASRKTTHTHAESSAEDDSEFAGDSDAGNTRNGAEAEKRRRVPGVPGDRLSRPTASREDSNRTIRGTARKAAAPMQAASRSGAARRLATRVGESERNATVRTRRSVATLEGKTRAAGKR
ncbi:uncharacterized protein FIBRA_03821 [Fibroporia radiculosa]|uniref:Protein YOP1 n=1 Tax=Fibroporia radiculosa TaxID=599839 RepID=J4GNP6_9APHY|nr:uncharacterized protein FIBRA_03821 [Fibroporia radiculosa]CCM01755.1 predicted protein [Fibroporia radiculosa]